MNLDKDFTSFWGFVAAYVCNIKKWVLKYKVFLIITCTTTAGTAAPAPRPPFYRGTMI